MQVRGPLWLSRQCVVLFDWLLASHSSVCVQAVSSVCVWRFGWNDRAIEANTRTLTHRLALRWQTCGKPRNLIKPIRCGPLCRQASANHLLISLSALRCYSRSVLPMGHCLRASEHHAANRPSFVLSGRALSPFIACLTSNYSRSAFGVTVKSTEWTQQIACQ